MAGGASPKLRAPSGVSTLSTATARRRSDHLSVPSARASALTPAHAQPRRCTTHAGALAQPPDPPAQPRALPAAHACAKSARARQAGAPAARRGRAARRPRASGPRPRPWCGTRPTGTAGSARARRSPPCRRPRCRPRRPRLRAPRRLGSQAGPAAGRGCRPRRARPRPTLRGAAAALRPCASGGLPPGQASRSSLCVLLHALPPPRPISSAAGTP